MIIFRHCGLHHVHHVHYCLYVDDCSLCGEYELDGMLVTTWDITLEKVARVTVTVVMQNRGTNQQSILSSCCVVFVIWTILNRCVSLSFWREGELSTSVFWMQSFFNSLPFLVVLCIMNCLDMINVCSLFVMFSLEDGTFPLWTIWDSYANGGFLVFVSVTICRLIFNQSVINMLFIPSVSIDL